jgi:hypothetical protein
MPPQKRNKMNGLKQYTKALLCSVGFLTTALLAGCGGGGGGADPILGSPAALPTVASIAVTHPNATTPTDGIEQFKAIATYSDGTTSDVTAAATWTSSTNNATVAPNGIATGVSPGTSLITATLGGRNGSQTMTVSADTLVSVAATASNLSIPIGATEPFTATATYSAGPTADVTTSSVWTSASPGVATVDSATGVVTGVSVGTSVITADFGGLSNNQTVTVTAATGAAAVVLGTAGNFAILTKTGITNVPSSAITGNIGTSPISGSSLIVTCPEVTGIIYSVDAAGPACRLPNAVLLTAAVSDMETAYTNAFGRPPGVGPNLNLGGGTVPAQPLAAGTYTWGSNVTITGNLMLTGSATDVWLFQVDGKLDISPSMRIDLAGGAQAKNVFWVVSGVVTLGTDSHFEGNILAKTNIAMLTRASINGRLLAQTAATLQQNVVTKPAL